jgi:hypothetical protein
MAPADQTSALVQGTLDMLILKTLALEPMHGYGIGMRLEQISHGAFQVNAGSPKRRGNGRHRLRRSRASCARRSEKPDVVGVHRPSSLAST